MDDQLMTPSDISREFAQEFGVTPTTIRRWGDSGKLRIAERTATGWRLFRRSDVLALLRAKGGDRA